MTSDFQDHFSGHASTYRQHRPGYPAALFDWLADAVQHHRHAWDCATGNGQAAAALADRFDHVTATDASAAQGAQATPITNVHYRTASAEDSGLADASTDLITVAQAAHWFDMPAFVREVERVLRPGGVLALWTYGLTRVTPAVDAIVDQYYHHTVGAYWPPERRHVETGYRDFVLPFEPLAAPQFTLQVSWTPAELVGYLRSWSATQRCIDATGEDVTQGLAEALAEVWPTDTRHAVHWPLSLRCVRRSVR